MDWHELRPLQALVAKRFFEKRFLLLMLPRQEGKTELAVRLIKSCLDSSLTSGQVRQATFIAKDKESAKRASKEKFLRLFDQKIYTVNTKGAIIKAMPATGCFIQSCDVEPDRMRGGSYHLFAWTEVAFAKFQLGMSHEYVIQAIVRPTTRSTHGYGFMESTPNGMNGWHTIWHMADEIGFSQLVVSFTNMLEMGLVTRDYYDKTKAEMHPDIFRQEMECEFVSFSGAVYPEFTDDHIISIDFPEPWQKVLIGIDWGFKDATCILAAFVKDKIFYIFDEIYVREKTLDEIWELLRHRSVTSWQRECREIGQPIGNLIGVADHEPDRNEELNRRGIPCSPAEKTNVLGNRLEIKEALMKGKIKVDPRCQMLIKDWRSATWNPKKTNEIDERICTWGHYDAEAAARYLFRGLKSVEEVEPERNPHEGNHDLSAMAYNLNKRRKSDAYDGW
jgi:hypothetical protein